MGGLHGKSIWEVYMGSPHGKSIYSEIQAITKYGEFRISIFKLLRRTVRNSLALQKFKNSGSGRQQASFNINPNSDCMFGQKNVIK
jgi:hypothetical protein